MYVYKDKRIVYKSIMKCQIPEISWHNRDPVLSVDIQPRVTTNGCNKKWRLASGGTDAHVLVSVLQLV